MAADTWWRATAWAVLRRPALWPVALTQAGRMAAPGWWRRPPFLPVPDPEYIRFRLRTAYGGSAPEPPPATVAADVVTYLRWCRKFR